MYRLAERADLAGRWRELDPVWPRFLHFDPNGLFFRMPGDERHALVALAGEGELVARAASVPLRLPRGIADLPADGLDEIVRWAAADRIWGRTPDAVSTVEVAVEPGWRGQGLGSRMLAALRDNARRLGFGTLVAPVRPVGKPAEPGTPLAAYAARRRPDGWPADPWLRAHLRLGGEVAGLAPYSAVVPGTIAQWRDWTGLPFDRSGPVEVPGALVPVLADLEHDYAVYVEPNLWVHHHLH